MIVEAVTRWFRGGTRPSDAKLRVLFVCMGNICRSPTADGVFRKMLVDAALERDVYVDSAGTHAYHAGEPPDMRTIEAAEGHDVDLKPLRARMFVAEDFNDFDYVLAMDGDNLRHMKRRREGRSDAYVGRLLDFAPESTPEQDVPDPYYGGPAGFDRVFSLVETGCNGLLARVKADLSRLEQNQE